MQRSTLILLLLAACGRSDGGPWDAGFSIPREPTESGDPERGRSLLLTGDYMSCGIPYPLWSAGGDALTDEERRAVIEYLKTL